MKKILEGTWFFWVWLTEGLTAKRRQWMVVEWERVTDKERDGWSSILLGLVKRERKGGWCLMVKGNLGTLASHVTSTWHRTHVGFISWHLIFIVIPTNMFAKNPCPIRILYLYQIKLCPIKKYWLLNYQTNENLSLNIYIYMCVCVCVCIESSPTNVKLFSLMFILQVCLRTTEIENFLLKV